MAEETSPIDYAAVLADLEAKRAQIDAAIAVIRPLALGGGLPAGAAITPGTGAVNINSQAAELREDTFFNLSIPEATKKYLGMRKKTASTPEIIDALTRGGQVNSSSENFKKTVASVLDRLDSTGAGVVRVARGTWGLASWYPNRPRKGSQGAKNGDEKEKQQDEGAS